MTCAYLRSQRLEKGPTHLSNLIYLGPTAYRMVRAYKRPQRLDKGLNTLQTLATEVLTAESKPNLPMRMILRQRTGANSVRQKKTTRRFQRSFRDRIQGFPSSSRSSSPRDSCLHSLFLYCTLQSIERWSYTWPERVLSLDCFTTAVPIGNNRRTSSRGRLCDRLCENLSIYW